MDSQKRIQAPKKQLIPLCPLGTRSRVASFLKSSLLPGGYPSQVPLSSTVFLHSWQLVSGIGYHTPDPWPVCLILLQGLSPLQGLPLMKLCERQIFRILFTLAFLTFLKTSTLCWLHKSLVRRLVSFLWFSLQGLALQVNCWSFLTASSPTVSTVSEVSPDYRVSSVAWTFTFLVVGVLQGVLLTTSGCLLPGSCHFVVSTTLRRSSGLELAGLSSRSSCSLRSRRRCRPSWTFWPPPRKKGGHLATLLGVFLEARVIYITHFLRLCQHQFKD